VGFSLIVISGYKPDNVAKDFLVDYQAAENGVLVVQPTNLRSSLAR
jgi:hypothetical protein